MPLRPLASVFGPERPELVFGIVAPTGTDSDQIQNRLKGLLKQYGYQSSTWRLSDMAKEIAGIGDPPGQGEYDRIRTLQDAGNKIREDAGRGDAMALHAMARILKSRPVEEITRGGQKVPEQQPLPGRAHILRSLKHPLEVEALRRVYGVGFFLIGVHSSYERRLKILKNMLGMTPDEARDIMDRDESEDDEDYGQQMRKTFHLSDVFVRDGDGDQLRRFLQLVFNAPFETPTLDEYAMSLAFTAAMRSAQPGRQVGAVLVSRDGEVVVSER